MTQQTHVRTTTGYNLFSEQKSSGEGNFTGALFCQSLNERPKILLRGGALHDNAVVADDDG